MASPNPYMVSYSMCGKCSSQRLIRRVEQVDLPWTEGGTILSQIAPEIAPSFIRSEDIGSPWDNQKQDGYLLS